MRFAPALVLAFAVACGGSRAPSITAPPPLADVTDIQGGAYVPKPGVAQQRGAITGLTSTGDDELVTWTFSVGPGTFAVQLPKAIAFPASDGEVVEAFSRVTGGGPNAFGNLRLRDDKGGLLLAVMWLPDDWKHDYGTPVASDRGDRYDSIRYRVRVTAPDGSSAEIGDGWRRVTLAGATFLGNGNATKRMLHGNTAPPDYVARWIDVALVRVR